MSKTKPLFFLLGLVGIAVITGFIVYENTDGFYSEAKKDKSIEKEDKKKDTVQKEPKKEKTVEKEPKKEKTVEKEPKKEKTVEKTPAKEVTSPIEDDTPARLMGYSGIYEVSTEINEEIIIMWDLGIVGNSDVKLSSNSDMISFDNEIVYMDNEWIKVPVIITASDIGEHEILLSASVLISEGSTNVSVSLKKTLDLSVI